MTTFDFLVKPIANLGKALVEPLLRKPARDLKREEAWTLIHYHGIKGELVLHTQPKNEKEERAHISTSIAGVQYMHARGDNHGRFGSVGARLTPSFRPTPQFAIVLLRFAKYLHANWGASQIVWGGIGAGSGRNTLDCHMTGSCVDFYGANTSRGGVIDVRRDWYYRPVYLPNGREHPKVKDSDDWWGNNTRTSYRLLITRDVEERLQSDKSYFNPRARDFFLDVFQFIHDECTVIAGDIAPSALRSGALMQYGVTMHPDYPGLIRRPHNDHMHFQLGQAIHKK
jgi:hypothetical protein